MSVCVAGAARYSSRFTRGIHLLCRRRLWVECCSTFDVPEPLGLYYSRRCAVLLSLGLIQKHINALGPACVINHSVVRDPLGSASRLSPQTPVLPTRGQPVWAPISRTHNPISRTHNQISRTHPSTGIIYYVTDWLRDIQQNVLGQ